MVRGQVHAPAALYPRERRGTHCTGGWLGPRTGLGRFGKSLSQRDSIPVPSSPQPVAIPTELPGPQAVLEPSKWINWQILTRNFFVKQRPIISVTFLRIFCTILFYLELCLIQPKHWTDRQTDKQTEPVTIKSLAIRGEGTIHRPRVDTRPNTISERIRRKQSVNSTKPIDNSPSWVSLSNFLSHFPVHEACLYTSITNLPPQKYHKSVFTYIYLHRNFTEAHGLCLCLF